MEKITRTQYKVNDFLSFLRSGTLVLSPSFQRRLVWPPKAKSLLMDTVVKGIPMPIIFLRERLDTDKLEPMREVVDGQQRLRTIISYVAPTLLTDFDAKKDVFQIKRLHNSELAQKTFGQLERAVQHQILNYEFSVHILPSGTEDREVLRIFARMNSNGVKANKQELRNAEYFGKFKNLAYKLAYQSLNDWRDWGVFSETAIARMVEVEETSDLIISMHQGLHGRSQALIDRFYKNHEEDYVEQSEIKRRFGLVTEEIRKSIGKDLKTTEFARPTLFNTLFCFYYELMFGLGSTLVKKSSAKHVHKGIRTAVLKASKKLQTDKISEELRKTLRGGTGNLQSVKARFNFLKGVYSAETGQ